MKLFISYSRTDKEWAHEFWGKLRIETDHDAWIDRNLVPAQQWWPTILTEIEDCDCFIYVLSPAAVGSIYCVTELAYALALNKPILPLMLQDCALPSNLRQTHYETIIDRNDFYRVLFKVEQGLRRIDFSEFPPRSAKRPPFPDPDGRKPAPGARMTDDKGVTMVYVPPTTANPKWKFMMGTDDITDDEKPVHPVVIPNGFWLDLTPVTNAMFAAFVKDGGYQNENLWTPAGRHWVKNNNKTGPEDYEGFTAPTQPRVGVTWFEAYACCQWRGGRLPTEAEWEWAARGPELRVYPWSNEFDPRRVIYGANSGGKTHAVGDGIRQDGASWVGVLDMSGNVWEWVSSIYRRYPYDATDGRESTEDGNSSRVLRGGSWILGDTSFLRAAYRLRYYPVNGYQNGGFRCARSLE